MPRYTLRTSFRLTCATLLAMGLMVQTESASAHHGGGGARSGGAGGRGHAGGGGGGGGLAARAGGGGMGNGVGCGRGGPAGGQGQASGGAPGGGAAAGASPPSFNPLATAQANQQQVAAVRAWNQQRAAVRRAQQAARQQFAQQVWQQMAEAQLIADDGTSDVTPHAFLMSQRRAQYQQQLAHRALANPRGANPILTGTTPLLASD